MSFSLKQRRLYLCLQLYAFAALIFLPLIYFYHLWKTDQGLDSILPALRSYQTGFEQFTADDLPCRHLPGAEDVFVVMKTGATETHERLPTHFRTTFRCIPHWYLISDFEEEVEGRPVHDSFAEMDEYTKNTAWEFQFYDKIHRWQAQGTMEINTDKQARQAAWYLDKWKPLPVAKKVLELRPDSKWYFFVDADTSIIWSNLLSYLSHLDAKRAHFIGNQIQVNSPVVFAHGGAGMLVSNKALRMLVKKYDSQTSRYHELLRKEIAGDLFFTQVMHDVGVRLTGAFPIFQGEAPAGIYWSEPYWCWPVITYHHMPVEWIEIMWEFEQLWLAEHQANSSNALLAEPIRHRHVFKELIQPYLNYTDRADWDNLSFVPGTAQLTTLEMCKSVCEKLESCMQWRFIAPGDCKIANGVRLGKPAPLGEETPEFRSGWVMDRIEAFVDSFGECREDWILEPDENRRVYTPIQ